jgi:hypothetical protein
MQAHWMDDIASQTSFCAGLITTHVTHAAMPACLLCRWRLHPCVADSVDKLLANDYGQLNTQDRSTGAAGPGGQQRVLVQFGSGHALHWAAGWTDAARAAAARVREGREEWEGDGQLAGGRGRTAAAVVAGGGNGSLPGKWLLQLGCRVLCRAGLWQGLAT